jgi:hypothetical protein
LGKQRFKQIVSLEQAIYAADRDRVAEILATEVDLKQDLKDRLLEKAIVSSSPEIIQLFLENGANSNYLHQAVHQNNFKICQLLLEYEAEVDRRDEIGNTPLINATFTGKEEVALCLIKAGADIQAFNILGLMPVHGAIVNNLQQVIKIFEERGISKNIVDLQLNLSVSIEDLYDAVTIAEDISKENETIVSFFALSKSKQLEIMPTLEQEYWYSFSQGDVLTDRALCVLLNDYSDFLNSIIDCFSVDTYSKIKTALYTIQTIIYNLPQEDNVSLFEELSSPKWLLLRWLSQYLKDYLYIDVSIQKNDLEHLVLSRLHSTG